MADQSQASTGYRDWGSALVRWTSGLLLFETVTGLAVHLLPFSVSTQVAVLIHTIVGLPFVVPALVYSVRHWGAYRGHGTTHYKLTGYLAVAALALLVVSGLVLTWQAAAGTRIDYVWRTLHIVGTYALIVAMLPHVALLMLRAGKQIGWGAGSSVRGFTVLTIVLTVVGCAAWGAWTAMAPTASWDNEFPEGYGMPYGDDRPFAPSLARTETGTAFDADSLAGSESCGAAGCHLEIYKEWQPSAHRYSAMDPGFQKVQSTMAEQNGPESTRYCGGCHDPVSLFSGTKNVQVETKQLTALQGYNEGVGCIACHSIRETDVKGNAAYVMTQPVRYLHERDTEGLGKLAGQFLVRAYPGQHVASYSRRMFKTPEFCAACHKQFVDKEVNAVGWVQLQNQYDNWRKSRWNHKGDASKTIECRECHMPLTDSQDPASGDLADYNRTAEDGMHRSHRFLGANQWIPTVLKLEGAEDHVARTEQWLRGEIRIPEIQSKWQTGPVIPLELQVPEQVKPGEDVEFKVVITSNKAGHDFPTGPLDIIQAWVELEVTDQDGNLVYASGRRDEKNFIEPGTFMFKAEPVDQQGNLIDKHNLWEMVGVRYRRALFPGFSDTANFAFPCPSVPAVEGAGPEEPVLAAADATPGEGATPAGQAAGDPAAGEAPPDKPQAPPAPEAVAGADDKRQQEFAFKLPEKTPTLLTVKAKLNYRKFDQYLLDFAFGKDSGLTARITTIAETSAQVRVGES